MLGGLMTTSISAILQFHTLWQLNMMQDRFIWGGCANNIAFFQNLLNIGYTSYQYYPFQDGIFFRMGIGNANDVFLALNALGWVLAIIGIFLLMFGFMIFVASKSYQKGYKDGNEGH